MREKKGKKAKWTNKTRYKKSQSIFFSVFSVLVRGQNDLWIVSGGEASIVVLRAADRFGFGEQVAEFGVVHFDAVVEVEGDFLVGQVF